MKNISRRVFIKGMAVAAVATAASTVLAGCNSSLIPGGETEVPVDTTTSSKVLVPNSSKKDETFEIITKGMSIDATTGYAVVSVEFINKLAQSVDLANNAPASNELSILAYVDGDQAKAADWAQSVPGEAAKTMLKADDTIEVVSAIHPGTTSGKLYFDMSDSKLKDWKTLYVQFDVDNKAAYTTFTFNK